MINIQFKYIWTILALIMALTFISHSYISIDEEAFKQNINSFTNQTNNFINEYYKQFQQLSQGIVNQNQMTLRLTNEIKQKLGSANLISVQIKQKIRNCKTLECYQLVEKQILGVRQVLNSAYQVTRTRYNNEVVSMNAKLTSEIDSTWAKIQSITGQLNSIE